MRPFLLSGLPVTDWLAVGMPMTNPDVPSHVQPMGVLESWVLLAALGLAFWGAVRLVIWLDVKLSAHTLFREINRELGIGHLRGRPKSR